MRFAVVVFACVLAAANAQFGQINSGQYNPFGNQFGNNRYNQQYNRYNPYNNYNRNQYYNKPTPTYTPFKPFASSTPFPRPSVTVTEATATVAPSVAVSPVKPVVTAPVPVPVVARVVADARNAEITKYGNEINPDGSYNYFYETSNGIGAQEQGTPRNFGGNPPVIPDVAQGSFSWTSPEGQVVAITYTADENGYQPSGDAIPKAPAIPALILRSLEYIAKNAPVNRD